MTAELEQHIAEIERREQEALDEKRAALWIQGEQAFTYWAASASSPIGRANSRSRLATATQAGVDPLVLVVGWLNGLAARAAALAEKAEKKEKKR